MFLNSLPIEQYNSFGDFGRSLKFLKPLRKVITTVVRPIAKVAPKITVGGHRYDLGGSRTLTKSVAGAAGATAVLLAFPAAGPVAAAWAIGAGAAAANIKKGKPNVAASLGIGALAAGTLTAISALSAGAPLAQAGQQGAVAAGATGPLATATGAVGTAAGVVGTATKVGGLVAATGLIKGSDEEPQEHAGVGIGEPVYETEIQHMGTPTKIAIGLGGASIVGLTIWYFIKK